MVLFTLKSSRSRLKQSNLSLVLAHGQRRAAGWIYAFSTWNATSRRSKEFNYNHVWLVFWDIFSESTCSNSIKIKYIVHPKYTGYGTSLCLSYTILPYSGANKNEIMKQVCRILFICVYLKELPRLLCVICR